MNTEIPNPKIQIPSEAVIQACWKVAVREHGASTGLFERVLRIDSIQAQGAIDELTKRNLIRRGDSPRQERRLNVSGLTRDFLLGEGARR